MGKEYLLDILYGVFVLDTSAFFTFIESERICAILCKGSQRRKRFTQINEQLDYVLDKIKEEDAWCASSMVDLLNETKKSLKD